MAVETLAEAALVVRPEWRAAEAGAREGAKKVGESAGKAAGESFGDKFRNAIQSGRDRLQSTMANLANVFIVGDFVKRAASFGIQTAASLEQARIGFATLLGSGKQAQAFLGQLQKFAAATPFELPGLIDSSRTLLGVGVNAKQVIPLLNAFGNAAGAVGVGQEAFQRIILATSQAISAGKFQVGDLNQIMTNGIPIYKILSEAMGKPVTEIRKLASSGQLLSKDVLPALQKQMNKDYGGAMARQSQTLAGVWSTLKDTVAIGLSNALTPLVPIMSDLVPRAANIFAKVLTNLGHLIAAFGEGFVKGKATASGFIGTLQSMGAKVGAIVHVFTGSGKEVSAAAEPYAKLGEQLKNEVIPAHIAFATELARTVIPKVINLALTMASTMIPIMYRGEELIKNTLLPILIRLAAWIEKNRVVVRNVALALGAWVAAMKTIEVVSKQVEFVQASYNTVLKLGKGAIEAWKAAVVAANVVMRTYGGILALDNTLTVTWLRVQGLELAAFYRNAVAAEGNTAAIIAQGVATKAAAVAARIWTAAQTALNFVLDANPIGLVVIAIGALVAGIIFAYQHSQRFRAIVQAAWQGIRVVVGAVVDWLVHTAWPFLKKVWDGIATASLFLWHKVIEPVWHAISRIIQAASAVIQLAIAIYVAYLQKIVFPVFLFLWHNVVKPVFDGIAAIVRADMAIVRAVINGIIAFIRGPVTTAWNWLWKNVIGPVWDGIRSKIETVVNIVRAILIKFGAILRDNVAPTFTLGVNAIRNAWAKIQDAAKVPVTFVVNHIINPLLGGFNKVAKAFHTPTIPLISGFEDGGPIPGHPSSRDNRWAWLRGPGGQVLGTAGLATGEYVVKADSVRKPGAMALLGWINEGMRGGSGEVLRRLGRPLTDMPGDGSEGFAFASGGLVGFLDNIWDAVSNPAKFITHPIEALLDKIPGAGAIKDVLVGMGHSLISGLTGWLRHDAGGGGNVGAARSFVLGQAGKPYVWDSAGPFGYDCSGIVSAVYNVLKGRDPYSHTFSTESLPGRFFHEGARLGALIAGWSHPGEAPASASVGHMAGNIGGLPFESRGSVGVIVGDRARQVGQFAHIGAAYSGGGVVQLAQIAKIAKADFGAVTLAPGLNLVANGTGANEFLSTNGAGGVHFHFHGPVASKRAAKDMVYSAWVELVRDKKIR